MININGWKSNDRQEERGHTRSLRVREGGNGYENMALMFESAVGEMGDVRMDFDQGRGEQGRPRIYRFCDVVARPRIKLLGR